MAKNENSEKNQNIKKTVMDRVIEDNYQSKVNGAVKDLENTIFQIEGKLDDLSNQQNEISNEIGRLSIKLSKYMKCLEEVKKGNLDAFPDF